MASTLSSTPLTRPLSSSQPSDWSDTVPFALSAPWAAPSDSLFGQGLVPGILYSDNNEIDTFDIPPEDALPLLNLDPVSSLQTSLPGTSTSSISSHVSIDDDDEDFDDEDPGHVSEDTEDSPQYDDDSPLASPLSRGGKRRRVSENELEIPEELMGMTSADIKRWMKVNRDSMGVEMSKKITKYMVVLRNRETALKSRERKRERLVSLENEKVELLDHIESLERKVEFHKAENAALRQQLVAFLQVIKSSRAGMLFQRMMVMERGHQVSCSSSTDVNLTEKCVNALAVFLAIALSNYHVSVAPGLIESATRLKKTMKSIAKHREEYESTLSKQ